MRSVSELPFHFHISLSSSSRYMCPWCFSIHIFHRSIDCRSSLFGSLIMAILLNCDVCLRTTTWVLSWSSLPPLPLCTSFVEAPPPFHEEKYKRKSSGFWWAEGRPRWSKFVAYRRWEPTSGIQRKIRFPLSAVSEATEHGQLSFRSEFCTTTGHYNTCE